MEGTVAFHRCVIRPTRPTDIFEMPRGSCGEVGGHKVRGERWGRRGRGGGGGGVGEGSSFSKEQNHGHRFKMCRCRFVLLWVLLYVMKFFYSFIHSSQSVRHSESSFIWKETVK